MALPTQEHIPIPQAQDTLLSWARRVTQFFNENLPVWRLLSQTAVLANGSNNNVDSSNAMLLHVKGPTGAFTITGLGGGSGGRMLTILNISGQAMTLSEEDALSNPVNRIYNAGAPGSIVNIKTAVLVYSDDVKRWIILSTT